MQNVVFVAPFFLETTLRFVDAVVGLPGVRFGLISQDPESKLPPSLRAKLDGHYRVDDALTSRGLEPALEAMQKAFGPVDRLLGTLEQLQVPLGELREKAGIEGMGTEAAKNFRDKARMKDVLRSAGLPCARHQLVTNAEAALAFARSSGFPLIVKPPAGAGAKATFRVDNEPQLMTYLESMSPTPEQPSLLEKFVIGEEHSFDSVMLGGQLVWYSINDYLPGPIEVLSHPWIQWCVVSPREVDHPRYAGIRDIAEPALKALGLVNGLSHMEWFRKPDGGIAISEVGARPPGAQFATLISYAHEFDLYRAWAELSVFDRFDPPPRAYAVGAAYLRGQGRGRVKTIHGISEAQAEVGDLVVEAKLPTVGQSPSGSYEGEGYVIVRHPETDVVVRSLKRIVERIRVELE